MSHIPSFRSLAVLFAFLTLPLSAATYTVTNTNDSGSGSLRYGIEQARLGTYDRIEFAIGSGPQTIHLLTGMFRQNSLGEENPDDLVNVVIDGRTQPGYAGMPLIELVGAGTYRFHALDLKDSEVYALEFNGFSYAIMAGNGATVRGCHFGPDLSEEAIRAWQWPAGSNPIRIGGANPGDGNVFETARGIHILATQAPLEIDGNIFGSDASMSNVIDASVHIAANACPASIGVNAPNVFLGANNPIYLYYAHGTTIENNWIGVTPDGRHFPPTHHAIYSWGSTDMRIASNTIYVSDIGIELDDDFSIRNTFTRNSIDSNDLAIDLGGPNEFGSVTPNDHLDADTGPNGHINFPVITEAKADTIATTVVGTLNSVPNRTYTIELFVNDKCPVGYGPAQQFLASLEVTTGSDGNASFSHTFEPLPGMYITATSTNELEGTSELSQCKLVQDATTISFSAAGAIELSEGSIAVPAVIRSGSMNRTSTVHWTATPATATPDVDYAPISGVLTFAPGVTTAEPEITLTDDSLFEATEEFTVTLSDPAGARLDGTISKVVRILDNDPVPAITATTHIDVLEGDSGVTNAIVSFQLSTAAAVPITIQYATAGGTATAGEDFVPAAANVTIPAGELDASVTIEIKGDLIPEGNEQLSVSWTGTGGSSGAAGITIVDNDAGIDPQLQWIAAGKSGAFSIQLPAPAVGDMTFTISSSAPNVVSVPSSVTAYNGQTEVSFDAQALLPHGSAIITIIFPPALGSSTRTVEARTYVETNIVLSPAQLQLYLGETKTVRVALDPSSIENVEVAIGFDSSTISTRSRIVVPAGGEGSLEVKGVAIGPVFLHATLPPSYGDKRVTLGGRVTSPTKRPTIASVVPQSGSGQGGTLVRITGTNFDSSCWPSFGSAAASDSVFVSATELIAETPLHAAGEVDVVMQCSEGVSDGARLFTYFAGDESGAALFGVSPLTASAGETVTATGFRFRNDDTIEFGGVVAETVATTPDTHVVRVPEVPLGKVSVDLVDARGRRATLGPIFTVTEAIPPRVTSLSPANVMPGGEVLLTGNGFRAGYAFRIGGRVATILARSYTQARVHVEHDTPLGRHAVEVLTPAGQISSIGPELDVTASGIYLHGLIPNCATTEGLVDVTIHGSGFTNGTQVRFGDAAATNVTLVDATTLTARVPPGVAGTVTVTASNSATSATLTNGFQYHSPFDPNSGCSGRRSRGARH